MRTKINGISVHYAFEGPKKGPVVALIHGYPFSAAVWKPQVALLKKNFRVLSYDLRGMGGSGLGKPPQLLEAYVDDFFALLKHLKISKAAVCGLSMGGYIVLRAYQREPGSFSALALCDTRADADSDEVRLKRAAGIQALRKDGVRPYAKAMLPKVIESKGKVAAGLLKLMSANKADGMANALAAMAARTDSTGLLNSISVPTLLLAGNQDTLTPPALMQAMADQIPGARMVTLPEAGHLSNLDNPGDFNLALAGFLKSVLL